MDGIACNYIIQTAMTILGSLCISLLVLWITLRSEKKKHREQLQEIREKNRIDAMPVFELGEVGFVHWSTAETPALVLEIRFKNIGNGVATKVDVEGNLDDESWCVPPNDSTNLIDIEKMLNHFNDSFELTIGYSDLYENQYKQTIKLVATGYQATLKLRQKAVGVPKLQP